jgi:hypothetical protein
MSSFLRVIINDKEIEGWKKSFIAAVVVLIGIGLIVFATYVVVLGLMAVFGVLP